MSANSPPVIPLRLPWTKAAVVLLVAVPLLGIVRAGNTTCISKQLDWYFDEVGESPCMTYQRLRQICNPDYQVTSFRSTSPGDQCDDVVSSCCCNSIAYALSMLCMNCLNDGDETNGIDAAPGGYRQYLGSCGPGTNQTLPIDAQTSVCNEDIKISITFYNLFWTDGSWYYGATKDYAHKDQISTNNDTFTQCPNQRRVSDSVTPSPTSSVTGASSIPPNLPWALISTSSASISTSIGDVTPAGQSHNGSDIGPIVGAVVGGVGAVLLSVAAIILWRIHWRRAPSTSYHPGRDSWVTGNPSDISIISMAPFTRVMSTTGQGAPALAPSMTGAVPMLESTTTPIAFTSDRIRPSPDVPMSPHHEDGSTIVEPPSECLPSVYCLWEHGGESTTGIQVLVGSQVSETKSVTGVSTLASSLLAGFVLDGNLKDEDAPSGDSATYAMRFVPPRR